MIHVAVDTLSIQPSSGGIRVYLRELLKAAAAEDDFRFTLICSKTNQPAFSDLAVHRIVRLPWSTRGRWLRILTQQIIVPWLAWRLKPDVLLAPVDIAPVLTPVPLVTCIHSSHLNAHHGYAGVLQRIYNRLFLGATVRRSRALIAISEYVRQETIAMFPLAAGKTSVVYHGGGLIEKARQSGWRPPIDNERAGGILFVGTLLRHKRPDALLRAYAHVRRAHGLNTPPLYIVGHDWGTAVDWLRGLAADEGIAEFVHVLGRVTDSRLLELYSQCRVLVLPSAVEGFGLPVVEAMQAAVPVVVANRCALPEIAGGAALIVDPDDETGMAQEIAEALWNPERRAQAITDGLARGACFNWPRCARETLSVLNSVARLRVARESR